MRIQQLREGVLSFLRPREEVIEKYQQRCIVFAVEVCEGNVTQNMASAYLA